MKLHSQPVEWAFLNRLIGLDPKMLRGCYIGGTSVWNIQAVTKVPFGVAKDIDIFVQSDDQFENARKALVLADYEKAEDRSTDKVYKLVPVRRGKDRPDIHLIKHRDAVSPRAILERFDFVHCQAVIEIDQKRCWHVEDWEWVNEGRILKLVEPYRGNIYGTEKRVQKFLDRGFIIIGDDKEFWEEIDRIMAGAEAEREVREPVRDRRARHDDADGRSGPDDDGEDYGF